MRSLGFKPKESRRVLELGDPGLLGLNMSNAAKAFEVGKPKTRRDKKSGAKKRKQSQIEAEIALERL
jgi:DNA (cytosine-5)-methyltransferase 1